MSVSGGLFANEEFLSAARLNRKVPSHLTGSEINSLSPTYPNQEITCTQTGSTFTADVKYRRNSANTAWLTDSGGKHTHDADIDSAGGLLTDIFYANLAKALWINEVAPSAGSFKHESSGGATITDVHPEVRLFCGTQNGAYAHATKSGIPISWVGKMRFIARVRVSHGTYVTARFGVNSESANDATASDGGGVSRMGFEACDSAGNARNYDVFSANGTTRSAVTTTTPVAQSAPHAYRLDYTPATDIKPYFDGGGSPLLTKTSAIPAGGSSFNTRLASAGIKQNNSFTAGNERTMFLSAIVLSATAGTTAWG